LTFLSLDLVSIAVSVGVGVYCWRRPRGSAARAYALVAFSQASWAMGYVFELASRTLAGKIFWDDFQFLGGAGWLVALTAFAVRYTGRHPRRPRLLYALVGAPGVLVTVLAYTDPLHGLIRHDARLVDGLLDKALLYDFTLPVMVYALVGYLVMVAVLAVLFAEFFRGHRVYRPQLGLVLAGNAVPVAGTLLTLTVLSGSAGRDISPITFAVGNLLVAWGLMRFRLFDLVPLAFGTVFESIEDPVVVLDTGNRVVQINPAACRGIGVRHADAIGRPAREVFARWEDLVDRFEDVREVRTEIEAETSAGPGVFELRIQPVRDRNGRDQGRVFLFRDISDLKAVENELRRHRDRLEDAVLERTAELSDANAELQRQMAEREALETRLTQARKLEAVGLLAGGVAHDFNNILTAILGCAEFGLADLDASSPVRPFFDDIRKAALKASDLTGQLLTFGRRQTARRRLIDVNDQIRDVLDMVRRLVDEEVAVETDLAAEPAVVFADPGQVQQVILNLCTNARDAMPEGGTLTIATANAAPDADAEHGWILVTAADTGCGMDDETQARIFDPFYTTKEVGRGTGLGLSVVHGVVKEHAGDIRLESTPGRGTTSRSRLPAAPAGAVADEPAAAPTGVAAGSERILVVEDDTMVREVTVRTLEELGYTVEATGDPRTALDLFIRDGDRIDLVVLDVVMPGLDGPALHAELAARRPGVRALFVTGCETDRRLDDLRDRQGGSRVAVLRKPFTNESMGRAVRGLLD